MEVPCETNARYYLILDRDRHVAHALDRQRLSCVLHYRPLSAPWILSVLRMLKWAKPSFCPLKSISLKAASANPYASFKNAL